MGSFYTNIALYRVNQEELIDYLTQIDRLTWVSPVENDFTIVYDAESDEQNTTVLHDVTEQLSRQFQCPALAVLNHDDDLLWYELFDSGKFVDSYNSTPNLFDDEPDSEPSGGDAEMLCRLFQAQAQIAEVEAILRKPQGAEGYIFAWERHRDLAKAVGLPKFAVGLRYNHLEFGNLPQEYDELVFTGT
jgi:hypothetical protein